MAYRAQIQRIKIVKDWAAIDKTRGDSRPRGAMSLADNEIDFPFPAAIARGYLGVSTMCRAPTKKNMHNLGTTTTKIK